ncbi:hypothetical protein BKA82DRAFT_3989288 [Pisolithus tinctorius]|nr:hypothetical protein BKA82DRAFT_3989288 [Pisolithus tinctorius]
MYLDTRINVLQENVRQHAVHLLGRGNKWRPFPMASVASSQETALYAATGRGGPTAEDFCLDFQGPLSSDWNKCATEVFASHFFECGWYGSPNKSAIKKVFRTHLCTLRAQYTDLQADSDPDDEQLQIKRDEEKENARDQRRHSPLWKTLPHDAMSGDESDHLPGLKRYAITRLNWHSQMATDWLRVFDLIHLSTRFNANGQAKRGAFPHTRVPSCWVESAGAAVPGLPSNFYDSTWLLNLDDDDKVRLNILPEVDLSHTEAVLR